MHKIQRSMKDMFRKYILLRLTGSSRSMIKKINRNDAPSMVASVCFKLYGYCRTKFVFFTMYLIDLLCIFYR